MHINFFDTTSTVRSGKARRAALREIGRAPQHTAGYLAFGYDYFDNPRLGVGYGGYHYDGRYAGAAAKMCAHYRLRPGDTVLEIGCAKGYMLVEFHKLGMQVAGIDASAYAVENAHPDVRDYIRQGDICKLPFSDGTFDLVFGKDVLEHNPEPEVRKAILECMRVSKGPTFFEMCVGRTPLEFQSMKEWDATYKTTQTPEWWDSLFQEMGFRGEMYCKVLVPEEEQ